SADMPHASNTATSCSRIFAAGTLITAPRSGSGLALRHFARGQVLHCDISGSAATGRRMKMSQCKT
ncbi:MAG TPA: hypothetical protein VKN16_20495, partial [Methylomirabilota bacterium]|nr:hypothetical protein [Methylomirabilota bacterium]